MKHILLFCALTVAFTSCIVNQDYYFNEDGTVQYDLKVDMSKFIGTIDSTKRNKNDFNIKLSDTVKTMANQMDFDIEGITDIKTNMDTISYIFSTIVQFENQKSFSNFLSKNVEDKYKPAIFTLDKKQFTTNNTDFLISWELANSFSGRDSKKESEAENDLNLAKMFKFSTTYHFPYEVLEINSVGIDTKMGEDKHSVTILNNNISEYFSQEKDKNVIVKFK